MTDLAKKKVQSVDFKRNAVKDLVTGNITYTDWQPPKATLPAVTPPTIAGYQPNVTTIPELDVTGDSQDTEVTVTYTPVGSSIIVNFIDADNNNHVLHTDTINGVYGQQTTYSPQSYIDELTAKNYIVDENEFPATAPTFQETPLTYNITFKHATIDATPDNPNGVSDLTRTVTRTITFVESED